MPLPNEKVKLIGPLGYDTLDAKDLGSGLCVVRCQPALTYDPVTRYGKRSPLAYYVASRCLGMIIGPPFDDWYVAVRFGNYMQTQFNWIEMRIRTKDDIAKLQSEVRTAIAVFNRDINSPSG